MDPALSPEIVDVRRIEDIDAMGGALTDGLEGEYVQLEAKPFEGDWTVVRLGDVTIQFAREGIAVARRVRVPGDRWAIIVPIQIDSSARWNGRAVRPNEWLTCPPRSVSYAFDPAGTEFAIVSVRIDSGVMEPARALVTADAPLAISVGPDAPALRLRLLGVRAMALKNDPALRAPRHIQMGVADAISSGLKMAAQGDAEVVANGVRSQIVRRADEFFRAHVAEGVSIAQLSTVAGVSERSLRNAFYDVYTTSPKRYMKLWQLHRVRHALRSAVPSSGTVTDVATYHGLFELGRFAGEYKALFGEAPSQTLRRAVFARPSIAAS